MFARIVWIVILCWGALPALAADAPALATARQLLLTGKYAEAEEAFAALVAEHPVAAAVGIARAKRGVGERAAAEAILREALAKHPEAADLAAELALLLFQRGAYDEAEAAVKKALDRAPDHWSARWLTAELLYARGNIPAAEAAYAWLVDRHRRTPARDAEALWHIGRATAQYARWKRDSGQFKRLVNEHYRQALADDPKFWPAWLETAELFAEKYNDAAAAAALDAALAINPQAAEAHAARGALALRRYDTHAARAALDRAERIDPELLVTQQLRADLHFAEQQPDLALICLEKARRWQPWDEETLGRLAACYLLLDRTAPDDPSARGGALIAAVTERNPHCGRFFAALADAYDLMRKYPQAADFYQQALEREPQLLYLRGRLGLVRMRLGEEAEAAKLLEESFRDDPFHVRVKNMLEVLDVLRDYAVLETDHFVIRFDRGQDELLARHVAKYLEEEVYPEVTQALGYEPEGKSLFEIFNRAKNSRGHAWFSARMVGLPFVGTVGACGGKIVAIASPNDMPSKFHWGRLVKHEFVHIVNLQQTQFHVPHWLTEGIAVRLENMPRPTAWNELLAARFAADELFTLRDINQGFLRPGSGDQWTLAYCQAELYCDYLVATQGEDALVKLLGAYRHFQTTEGALQTAFGVGLDDFERGYRDFVARELTAAGYRPGERKPAARGVAELEQALAETPGAADVLAELALAHWKAGEQGAARRRALAAREREPRQPQAAYVLARLQLAGGDTEGAIALLTAAHDEARPDRSLVGLLAGLRYQADDFAGAERLYRLGGKHFAPREPWLKALAKLYLKAQQEPRLAEVLAELAWLDADNATLRKKLAQLALKREDWPAAELWAKEALFIDLADAEVHAQLAEARVNQERWAGGIEAYETAIELAPDQPAWRLALADACLCAGDKPRARAVLERLLKLAPRYPGAELMWEQLRE